MQDRTKIVSILGSCCRTAIAVIVLVFLKESLCSQDTPQHRECGHIYNAAVRAELEDGFIEAELRYEECRDLARKYRIPKMEAAALHRQAIIKARNKKFTESAKLFSRANELDPRNAMILCDHAQLYIDRRDYSEAEVILKKAFDIDPNNPKVLFSLGSVIASQRGERQIEGLRYLKLAIGEAEANRELARISYSKGDINGAEFFEQRAKEKLAEPAPQTSYMLTAEKVPNNPAPPQQTPPEVVNRVRKELVDVETSNTIAQAQRQMIAAAQTQKPVAQQSTVPAQNNATPVNPEPKAVVLQETAAAKIPPPNEPTANVIASAPVQTPQIPPVDPFAIVHPLDPPSDPFEQAMLAAQPLPKESEPLSQPVAEMPKSDQKPKDVPLVHVVDNKPVIDNKPSVNSSGEPQLSKIASPVIADAKPLQRVPLNSDKPPVATVRQEPAVEKQVAQEETSNPLRQIPPGGAGLIDPSTESASIAALPSFAAVEAKKLVNIDKAMSVQKPLDNVLPQVNEIPGPKQPTAMAQSPMAQPSLSQPASIARTLEPVQSPATKSDVDVLQSPATVLARRDLPVSKLDSAISASETSDAASKVTANSSPNNKRSENVKQEQPSEKKPEYARIIRSGQRFNSKSAPAVLKFGAIRNEPPPEEPVEKLVEIASTQPAIEQPRPLKIVKSSTASRSEPSMPVEVTPAIDPFLMAADTPLPLSEPMESVNSQRNESVPELPLIAAAPSVSLPIEAAKPNIAEVKKIEPQPPTLPVIASASPVRLPMTEEAMAQPRLGAVQKIEPGIPMSPAVSAASPDPFLTVKDKPALPKFAEVTKPDQLSKAVVPTETPKLAAAKPLTIQQPAMVQESIIRPIPPEDTPAGFASTRKKVRTAIAEDHSMGFARSRR